MDCQRRPRSCRETRCPSLQRRHHPRPDPSFSAGPPWRPAAPAWLDGPPGGPHTRPKRPGYCRCLQCRLPSGGGRRCRNRAVPPPGPWQPAPAEPPAPAPGKHSSPGPAGSPQSDLPAGTRPGRSVSGCTSGSPAAWCSSSVLQAWLRPPLSPYPSIKSIFIILIIDYYFALLYPALRNLSMDLTVPSSAADAGFPLPQIGFKGLLP